MFLLSLDVQLPFAQTVLLRLLLVDLVPTLHPDAALQAASARPKAAGATPGAGAGAGKLGWKTPWVLPRRVPLFGESAQSCAFYFCVFAVRLSSSGLHI